MKTFRVMEMADGDTHQRYMRAWGWPLVPIIAIALFILSQYDILYLIFPAINYVLCDFISPDLDQLGLTKDDGDMMRTARKYRIGLLGAFSVMWWFLYAYIISWFGGHRSWASHGVIVGTIGRVVFFNIPIAALLFIVYDYGVLHAGWPTWSQIGWRYFYMDVWVKPYLISQLTVWLLGDGIHLILDTEWAKGKLYEPNKNRK